MACMGGSSLRQISNAALLENAGIVKTHTLASNAYLDHPTICIISCLILIPVCTLDTRLKHHNKELLPTFIVHVISEGDIIHIIQQ
jgi:hypothetical protein